MSFKEDLSLHALKSKKKKKKLAAKETLLKEDA